MNTQLIKICIWAVIIGLALSGLTAFPIQTELAWLVNHSSALPEMLKVYLIAVYQAIKTTNQNYPYLSYGTDWLAFAHLVLALLFVGPLRDPVKNIWVIEFGMIACLLIFPLACIAGSIRDIPIFWRLIACSFGVFAFIPLYIAYRDIKKIKPKPRSL